MDTPLYVSRRSFKNFWQQYRVYTDRVELQSWFLFGTLRIPKAEIVAVDVLPAIWKTHIFWRMKLDWADVLPKHVMITRKTGFFKRLTFAPDDPEAFAAACQGMLGVG